MTEIKEISLEDAFSGYKQGKYLLVDVREQAEHNQFHIENVQLEPLSRFNPENILPSVEQEVVFFCAAGVRSLHAIEYSLSHGYSYIAHIPDGIKGWIEAGYPVKSNT